MPSYHHHSSKRLVKKRIIAGLFVSALLMIAGVASIFMMQLKNEQNMTTDIDPPETSQDTTHDDVVRASDSSFFDSAEDSSQQLQELHDNQRRENIDTIHQALQAYFAQHNSYPTLTHMNSEAMRQKFFPKLENDTFRDPEETQTKVTITRTPQHAVYAYEVVNSDGYTCEPVDRTCVDYTLSALLSTGMIYAKSTIQ